VYGDSSLWYVIAEANGITRASDMSEGMSLVIPATVSSTRNNTQVFRPYDPSNIRGDNMPALPKPQGGDDGGCGGIGQMIVAIVAIAVTAIFQQYELIPEILDSALATQVANAAVAAAAGNIAGQLAANAVGIQDGFSWRSVATAAVSAGLTEGLVGRQMASPE
jgi:hypothetical protein